MSLCVSSGLYLPFSPSFFRNGRGTAPDLHLPVFRPPALGVLSLVFPLLLLALCCALALPAVAQAGEKQAQVKPRVAHKLIHDRGWNVCRDMVKNLDLLQQSHASFSCELKFHPSMTQFSEPEWEELKIEDHWELVYNIEREILSDNIARSRLPFEEWIVRYKQDWQSGCYEAFGFGVAESEKGKCFAFVPRLRRAQVRFSQNGPMETVLAYSLTADNTERCLEFARCYYLFGDFQFLPREKMEKTLQCAKEVREKQSGIFSTRLSGGDHVVVYRPEERDWLDKIVPIFFPGRAVKLFLHNQQAFLVVKSGAGGTIYRVKRDDEFPEDLYARQEICDISRPYEEESAENKKGGSR